MEQKNYFIAVDKNGHILNDFKMKCNYIEIKDNGIYFYEKIKKSVRKRTL